jgi:hypothetical protein
MITEVLERPRRWRPVDDTPMNAGGERRISEHPLPVWWKLDVERIARCQRERQGPMKARFSRQIGVLKRMGFGDESVILTALTEAAGNVPRAAKLLMRNVPSR